jgi:hypothetical protein
MNTPPPNSDDDDPNVGSDDAVVDRMLKHLGVEVN